MDLKKCKILLDAIDYRNLSKVARDYGYTPSGIWRMINSIEGELGFPLFVSGGSGVVPTDNCLRLAPSLRELLKCNERLAQTMCDIKGMKSGNITIGSYPSVSIRWLPHVIKAFQADYPGVTINIREGIRQELQGWLDEMSVELCFYTWRPGMKCHWIPLKEDPIVAVLPPGHPLAGAVSYPLARCRDERFIMPALGRDEDIYAVFEEEGISPRIVLSTIENFAAISMIECGLGMSIMNELITKGYVNKAAILPLDPPRSIKFGIAIPSLQKASPAALEFARYARRMIAEM
ncbi:MAG: LysR substrate-binding domain-containing protein [Synergistaceae bacterium]|nr:LysR substrate-binding domain-containing protein [Synergistaceae bacterium]